MQLENFNFRDKFDMLLGAVDNSMQLIGGKGKTGIMLVPTPTKSSLHASTEAQWLAVVDTEEHQAPR